MKEGENEDQEREKGDTRKERRKVGKRVKNK